MNIEHNYIHDVSYSAISMGWGWNRDLVVIDVYKRQVVQQ